MSAIQEVFNRFYTQYCAQYTPTPEQNKVAGAIIGCRTEAMGNHAYVCEECGHIEISHNSCRNRHCPNCQASSRVAWVEARGRDVLDAPYFHAVFTVPAELNMLIYQNRELMYDMMYKASKMALMKLAKDSRFLGAQPGFFSILHTWGNNLCFHPHIHMVIVAGGLTKDGRWVSGKDKFFIPVKVLSKMFRGIFMDYLKRLYKSHDLYLDGLTGAKKDFYFHETVTACYKSCWYTYMGETFRNPAAVLKYLGRYTHRVAISNERIISVGNNCVVFKMKIAGEGGGQKLMTLRACLKSFKQNRNKSELDHIKSGCQMTFTIFPQSAALIEPTKRTFYNPPFRNDCKFMQF
jgi:hypothetical protein